jgi:hypothetical protein
MKTVIVFFIAVCVSISLCGQTASNYREAAEQGEAWA